MANTSQLQRRRTSEMTLNNMRPQEVTKLLAFVYTSDYGCTGRGPDPRARPWEHCGDMSSGHRLRDLKLHACMYALADRLSVRGLGALAIEKFRNLLATLDSAAATRALLKSDIPRHIYESMPSSDNGLCTVLVEYLSHDGETLLAMMQDREVRKIVDKLEGLTGDVLERGLLNSLRPPGSASRRR